MVKKMKRAEGGPEPRTEPRCFVRKTCPQCEKSCPVALRACQCGYSFIKTKTLKAKGGKVKKGKKGAKGGVEDLDKEGRRFRTKRMRPDYFNSLELEYASKTYRPRKPKEGEQEGNKKKKRGRPKGSTGIPRRTKEKKMKDEEAAASKNSPELEDLYANFPPERLQQFSYILDELNFKMSSQIFKPL